MNGPGDLQMRIQMNGTDEALDGFLDSAGVQMNHT
jgi:hypothetical protein